MFLTFPTDFVSDSPQSNKHINMSSNLWCIVPAAGAGQRFSGPIPKQFLPFQNHFLLVKGLKRLLDHPAVTGVVLATDVPHTPEDLYENWLGFCEEYKDKLHLVSGAQERVLSVEAGLQALLNHQTWTTSSEDLVLVHDGARPCLSLEDLNGIIEKLHHAQALNPPKGVMLGKPVTDTLKRVTSSLEIQETLDRSQLWQAQTPQGGSLKQLQQGYQMWREQFSHITTDECQLMALAGIDSICVQAQKPNPKLTYQDDLPLVMHLLSQD